MAILAPVREVNFSDISKHLASRDVKPIEETKLGAGNFLLHVITIPHAERFLLETELGEPYEIVNEFRRYKGSTNGLNEDTYIGYVRDPLQWQ